MTDQQAIPLRLLILNEDRLLGRADGPDRFHCHWEWWMQCGMVFRHRGGGHELSEQVTAGQARAMANILDGKKGDRIWKIHLAAWGDSEGRKVRQFVRFLRGGGFSIIKPNGQEAGEVRIIKIKNHF